MSDASQESTNDFAGDVREILKSVRPDLAACADDDVIDDAIKGNQAAFLETQGGARFPVQEIAEFIRTWAGPTSQLVSIAYVMYQVYRNQRTEPEPSSEDIVEDYEKKHGKILPKDDVTLAGIVQAARVRARQIALDKPT